MKAGELKEWVDMARGRYECVRLVVKRARKTGPAAEVFVDEGLKELDTDALLVRLRDDVASFRRTPTAYYELAAFQEDDTTATLRDRLIIGRDEELDASEGSKDEDPNVAMVRVMGTHLQATHGKMLECVDRVLSMSKTYEDVLTKYREKEGEILGTAFDMASLKEESKRADEASSERRDIIGKAITELTPIVGSLIAGVGKKSGPAIVSLFQSLTPEQVDALQGILAREQLAALSTIVTMVQEEKKGATS